MQKELSIQEQKWKDEGLKTDDIKFKAANWKLLTGLRYVIDKSFEFTIQSVGVYENKVIVSKACGILISLLAQLDKEIDADDVPIETSDNILENSYDIVLKNEDYTVGNILNTEIYNTFYKHHGSVDFVGYKKLHPHDTDSILRVSLTNKTDGKEQIKHILKTSIENAIKVFTIIKKSFN